jgi:hypothetical protein
MSDQIHKATTRLIDSVWTLEYQLLANGKLKIIRHCRNIKEGYDNERSLPQFALVEDDHRYIVGIMIRNEYQPFSWVNRDNCDAVYMVSNPKYIFGYGN